MSNPGLRPLGGPYNTTLMQAMLPQNLHMPQTMWGPAPQPWQQYDTALHSPAGLGQFQPTMMQPGAINAPLQDAAAEVVNTAGAEKRGRKRKNATASTTGNGTAPTRKRQKKNTSTVTRAPAIAAAVCGVGPVTPVSITLPDSANTVPDALTCEAQIAMASLTTAAPTGSGPGTWAKQPARDSKAAASDVWYFMWAVDSSEKPEKMPKDQPRLMNKPSSPYVACRLCGCIIISSTLCLSNHMILIIIFSEDEENPQWKVYKVGDGMTPTYRNHLHKHGHQWKEVCVAMRLKKAEEDSGKQIQRQAFMVDMFYHLLMKWVAVDDQVFNMSPVQLAIYNSLVISVLQCC